MMIIQRSCLRALAATLLLTACSDGGTTPTTTDASVSDAPAADAPVTTDTPVTTDAPAAPMGAERVLQMCRTVHACGYTTAQFGIPSDLCTERAFNLIAHRLELDSPEQRVRYARMADCATTSTTCDAYLRCVEFNTPCSGSATPSCVGNVAVRCSTPGGNHLPRVFDCTTVGQTCMNGVCVLPAGANECATPGGGRCDGNVRAWCRPRVGGGNGEVREPCPAGTVCLGGGTGGSSPGCMPAPATCAAEGARCDGDTAVLCLRDRDTGMMLEDRSDCASIGRRCMPDARGIARCVPRATGCTIPAPSAASGSRCDGAAISVCLEGVQTRIDCSAVGRGACMMVMPPAGLGPAYAGCAAL